MQFVEDFLYSAQKMYNFGRKICAKCTKKVLDKFGEAWYNGISGRAHPLAARSIIPYPEPPVNRQIAQICRKIFVQNVEFFRLTNNPLCVIIGG
jgi:hypothetical protein